MCGLLTLVCAGGDAASRREDVAAANEQLHHRGPDDTGVEVVDGDVVMAHKRLSVIDVESSRQPLWYDGGRYVLAYNGEIYNYRELRAELTAEHGAEFATEGDGEVVAAGYRVWGRRVVERLRGMFAFVLWDRVERRGLAARDPFGIKPLFLLRAAEGLYFSSEKKALMPFADHEAVNLENLSHYLTLQYPPEPGSLHHEVERLPAGALLEFDVRGATKLHRHFDPQFAPRPVEDSERLYREILEVLRDSVRVHMRSDVPTGTFLSSGIDSTAITALAREVNANLLAFTVGFDVAGHYNELDVAQESAAELGVKAVGRMVGPEDMMEALPRIVWHLDDPVADPALVPLYYVAQTAAEHVTVALGGEGADELFGGYAIYREPLSLRPVQSLPAGMRRGLQSLARAIPEGVKGKSFLERGTVALEERFVGNAKIFSEAEKGRLMTVDVDADHTRILHPIYGECAGDWDDPTRMQYVDLKTWMRGDILVKADRMSMAHSLEVRVPFLDREVFDVARRLPTAEKVRLRGNHTKYALRRALADVVPAPIVDRPKLGFPTPTRVWLGGEMFDWADQILAESGCGHLIDLEYTRELLRRHRDGQADTSRKVWTVLIFCLWHAVHVEKSLDPGVQRSRSQLELKPKLGQPAV